MILPVFFMTRFFEERKHYATRTLAALEKLMPTVEKMHFFVSDGNSPDWWLDDLKYHCGRMGPVTIYSSEEKPGVRWSKALDMLFKAGFDYYLRLEDDFELALENATALSKQINRWADILEHHHEIGMIRLGLMPINLEMKSIGLCGEIFFHIQPTTQYMYSGNPGLIHRRVHDRIGLFHPERNPGDQELYIDEAWRTRAQDLQVLWPLEMGQYGTHGPWKHIGEAKTH